MALERVHPDDSVGAAGEPGHLAADRRGVLALPPVGDDDDYGPAGERPPAPEVVERLQRRADACPARPVDDALRGLLERALGVGPRELVAQPGQPRAEGERLDAAAALE